MKSKGAVALAGDAAYEVSGFLVAEFAVAADTGTFGAFGAAGVDAVIKVFEVDVLYAGWFGK
jgi:hypothetical protein